jgi:hypothetical protein
MTKTFTLIAFMMLSLNSYSTTLSEKLHIKVKQSHTKKLDSYRAARIHMFGNLHYDRGTVTDVYCQNEYTSEDGISRTGIPDSRKLNCEHTWPQSKFSTRFEKITQKTDLHHLFPTNSRANSTRSNFPFSNVRGGELVNCSASSRGNRADGTPVFEVPDNHKGNAARAIFYFSIRYNMKIDQAQEATLREWHEEDQVDSAEIIRNDKIQNIQGNRNPFIDQPELVERISNF